MQAFPAKYLVSLYTDGDLRRKTGRSTKGIDKTSHNTSRIRYGGFHIVNTELESVFRDATRKVFNDNLSLTARNARNQIDLRSHTTSP